MSRKPMSKRKRTESCRSQASGISALSNIKPSTDDLNDGDDRFYQTSNYDCNGMLPGSRTDAINIVQPQINFDSQTNPSENKRQRRVSWGVCDEDEETIPKEFNSQSDIPNNNKYDEQNRFSNQFPCVDIYARTNDIPLGRGTTSQTPINNYTVPESHRNEVELRRQIVEQQKTIAHLLERDKTNTQKLLQKQKMLQRRSVSVTSLRESPKNCITSINRNGVPEHHLYESVPRRPQTNIPVGANMNVQNDRVFVFPSGCASGVTQRRSRSCDFLLNDEEGETFISPPNRNSLQTGNSSGYEHVAEHSSVASLNESENRQIQDKSNGTTYCRYDFRRCFFVLLVFNTVIILLNVTGIPFVHVALNQPQEKACIKCELLSNEHIEKFQKDDDQCCLKSTRQLFELFANVTQQLESLPLAPQALTSEGSYDDDIPMVQYKARSNVTIGNINRISWMKDLQYPIQRAFGPLDPDSRNTAVTIPAAGLYYIFSRVHYRKTYENDIVTFGHSIWKLTGTQVVERKIDSVEETCFPRNDIVMHTSHLNFVHNFTKNDKVFVSLDHGERSDGHTMFGLFLIQKL